MEAFLQKLYKINPTCYKDVIVNSLYALNRIDVVLGVVIDENFEKISHILVKWLSNDWKAFARWFNINDISTIVETIDQDNNCDSMKMESFLEIIFQRFPLDYKDEIARSLDLSGRLDILYGAVLDDSSSLLSDSLQGILVKRVSPDWRRFARHTGLPDIDNIIENIDGDLNNDQSKMAAILNKLKQLCPLNYKDFIEQSLNMTNRFDVLLELEFDRHSEIFNKILLERLSSDWRNLAQCTCLFEVDYIIEHIDHDFEDDCLKLMEFLKKLFEIDPVHYKQIIKNTLAKLKRFSVLQRLKSEDEDDSDDGIEQLLEKDDSDIGIEEKYRKQLLEKDSLNSSVITCKRIVKKDISEICTALKKYYLTKYGKINEFQPPANVDLMNKFVDLCIIDAVNTQRDAIYIVERKKFLEKQLCYTPIPYNKIFMKEKSVTLISGIAGIGKTWLLRKCLLDWSNDLIWKNVKCVFYLECRRLNQYQNISNINELLNVFYKDIANDFDISVHTVLFIIDGLDEFKYLNELINHSSSCNYPIVNALTEIQKYKYVLAGRVYAIDQYQSISTEHSDKLTIQIMGFNENGINNYIENNVLEEKKDVVKATLKESPIAKSMSSVPFYLSSMCKIISYSKNVDLNYFLTMTELYANIFLYFLQNHIFKNNELIYKIMENDFNKKYVLNICKIAYQLFVENKVFFSKEEIQTFIIDFDENNNNFFGFIEMIETNLGYYYQFAHLTIMEFCASVYAYNCLSSEEIMADKRLESCLSMICGLTNKNQNCFLKFLVNLIPSKQSSQESLFLFSILDRLLKLSRQSKNENDDQFELETYYDNLFIECFYESQSSFTDEIKLFVDERKWKISIRDGKTSYETSCENYFVNHYIKSGRKLYWLGVYKNILSDEEKNLIIQCSRNVRELHFWCPIKFEGWKDKIKWLWINIERLFIHISDDLITNKDFEENFLPWINLCEELTLSLHDDIDFIEEIYEWIRCSNVKELLMENVFITSWKTFL
ncbi:uncharacterized protein LOC136076778 isoform X2 [Hydra vulgaris]